MAATNKGVFIGHQTRKDKLLGERVDTTGHKQMGISFVNQKGKTKGEEKCWIAEIDPKMHKLGKYLVYLVIEKN